MPKLLFLVTEDWFFRSHFLARAVAARNAGFEVVVAARRSVAAEAIEAAGIRVLHVPFDRGNLDPTREMRVLLSIVRIYRDERPTLVHHVAAKPIFLGSVAAMCTRPRPAVVNAPVGLGYVFSSADRKARWLRRIVTLAYRLLLDPPRGRVILENSDDVRFFAEQRMARRENIALIRGAGVDTVALHPVERCGDVVTVVFAARMLRDKGLYEFIEAARSLLRQGVRARFVLAGDVELHNPASVSRQQLEAWQAEEGIEWTGWVEDMRALWQSADIACLPSYREGLPKVLIEAASCGLPIVTTDTVGCREVVTDGLNGLLVPVGDAGALATALFRLVDDPRLRSSMGAASRRRAETEFSTALIERMTLTVYRELCGGAVR